MVTNVKAVTVFNGRLEKASRRKVFIPTVIRNVFYAEAKGATVTNNGVWSEDVQYKIRIPFFSEIQGERSYVPDLHYAVMDDEEAVKHWTICKGDMIIRDEHAWEVGVLFEDEILRYAAENGLSLIRVKEHADNTDGGSLYTKHWRIGAK